MASYRKRGPHQWEARVRKKGYPTQCRTFETKKEAMAWASMIEAEMARGVFVSRAEAENTTLAELLDRYAREVTPSKKGAKKELQRLRQLRADPLGLRIVASIRGVDIAAFRDRRLKDVKPSTVIRDLNLLSHVFNIAMKEWNIALASNPVAQVRRPKVTASSRRDRRLGPGEEQRLLRSCQQDPGPWLKAAVELAIETGMRRGELVRLRWDDVDLRIPSVRIRDSKNGEGRVVPLSARAVSVLKRLPSSINGRVFQFASADALTMAFRRACARAGLKDLRFHDLRHEATSRFFEKGLNPMQVSAITGHRSPAMLQRYTHLRAEDLAKLL